MKRFNYLFLFMTFLSQLACKRDGDPKKMNFLFILADDQCFNTVNALGNHEVITPNLDHLVNDGTVFSSVYNMGGWNGAICIASRTMLNTGKFLWHAESEVNNLDTLAAEGKLWGREMENLGYETYFTGKWHIKVKPQDVFNHVGTVRGGMPGDHPAGYDRPLSEDDLEWTPWDTAFGGYWEGGVHWSEVIGNETVGFIDQAAQSAKPFFMYIAFNAPHDPRQSPKEFVDLYDLDSIALPENFVPLYPYKDKIGCGPDLRDERLAPFPRTEYAVKVHRQEYYAIITHMDRQIGRIIEELEKTGQLENTYIFFTADHGLAVGDHGFIGKQNMYESSLRPPLIVVGPDIPKGKKRKMNIYLQDVMPTVIDYAGGQVPEYVEFSSLRELINNEKAESGYPEVYAAYKDLLIVYPYAGIQRLYNLEADPLEMNDLANLPEYGERRVSMFRSLLKVQQNMNDTLHLERFSYN